jgi:TrmH family RNA methyltransferase
MSERTTEERFHRARKDPELAVLEGFHALKHALRFGAEVLETAIVAPDALGRLVASLAPDLSERLPASDARIVTPQVFARLAPRPPATGVIAIARRRPAIPAEILGAAEPAPVVLLVRPWHAGNLGAAVRVAAAAEAAGLLALGGRDPWEPEAIRGAAGLQFALPVAGLDVLPSTDRPFVAVDPGGDPPPACGLPARALLAFGTERHGLDEALLSRADLRVAIPMLKGVSSLNLATAVAVALYGWRPFE